MDRETLARPTGPTIAVGRAKDSRSVLVDCLLGDFFEKLLHELLIVIAISSVVGTGHVVVAELSGVVEDEIVRDVLNGSIREIGEVHH